MKRILAALLALLLLFPFPALAACTNTPNLSLCKPAIGDTGWGANLNTNFDKLDFSQTNSPAANTDSHIVKTSGTINEAASGTHPDFIGALFSPPTIVAGVAALTNATTIKVTAAPSGATNNRALWIAAGASLLEGEFRVSNVGPHAIGGATFAQTQLGILGSFAPADAAVEFLGVNITSSITATANRDATLFRVGGTLVEAGAGTHVDFIGVKFVPPTITAGVAALTNASTVKITDAPTGATNNYALWVVGGALRLDGVPAIISGTNLHIGVVAGSSIIFNDLASVAPGASTERMRFVNGILALGTTVTTSGGAGDVIFPFGTGDIRAVNAAGTDTFHLIGGTTGNSVSLAEGGADIRWGRALVALGGGAAPTFGTIGGSGPTTAGQNTWMRVLDSSGAAFWVPAWK